MKVMGVSEPDLDRRGASSACGGWRESPHRYQTPIVPWLPRGPRTQLTAGQERSLSIQAQPTMLLSLTHFQHWPFCGEGAQGDRKGHHGLKHSRDWSKAQRTCCFKAQILPLLDSQCSLASVSSRS